MKPPHSLDAERSVIGQLLRGDPKIVAQVIGAKLEPEHFYAPAHKILISSIFANHFADLPFDPITIGEKCAKALSDQWSVEPSEAVARVRQLATERFQGRLLDHAQMVQ